MLLSLLLLLPALSNALLLSQTPADSSVPGVTAVLLNWARLHNVVHIVRDLCSEDLIRTVVVWNNNPRLHLTRHHFECPERKLHIVNSPSNDYFQARFLACSSAITEFCFIQDDDYLVRTDVIRSLYAYLSSPAHANTSTVHLLPPHEHLSTTLRSTFTQDGTVHTGFAWLGHGALLRRSASTKFLQLLGELGLSDWEMKMADNYYTILGNAFPVVWMDDGIPLDGTGAFTVGDEGDERNWDHITRALRYFERRLHRTPKNNAYMRTDLTYTPPHPPAFDSFTAVCLGAQHGCTITSNINLNALSTFPLHSSATAFNMRAHEEARRRILGPERAAWLLQHPLTHAVDLSRASAFRSWQLLTETTAAAKGDYVLLDLFAPVRTPTMMLFVVDAPTARIIQNASVFDLSQDGTRWVGLKSDTNLQCLSVQGTGRDWECTLHVQDADWRFVRVRVVHSVQERWTIFDVRVEGI